MSAGTTESILTDMLKKIEFESPLKIKGFNKEIKKDAFENLFEINGDKVVIKGDEVDKFFRTAEDELEVSVIYKNSQGNFVKLEKMDFKKVKGIMKQSNKEIKEGDKTYEFKSGPNNLEEIKDLNKPIVFKEVPSGAQTGNNSGQGEQTSETNYRTNTKRKARKWEKNKRIFKSL